MKNHLLFIPALIAFLFTSCSTAHFSQPGNHSDAFAVQSGVQATPPASVSASVEMSKIEPEMVNIGHSSSTQLRTEFQTTPFNTPEKVTRKTIRAEMQQFTREQKKELRKAILYASLGKEIPESTTAGKDGAPFIDQTAAAIIAFFIPPLGAGLYFGKDKRTWISLGLTLLFWLPGAIYSIIVILKD